MSLFTGDLMNKTILITHEIIGRFENEPEKYGDSFPEIIEKKQLSIYDEISYILKKRN
jgi:hypothetical protein